MKRLIVSCSISLTLGLGLTLVLWSLLNSTPVAHADPGDLFASPGGDGTACSQAQPCLLQTALGNAISGETIYLAEGTYTGSGGAVVTVTKNITLAGGWDSVATGPIVRDPDTYVSKLDGQGQRRVVYINGSVAATLDGLQLTRGWAAVTGGGIYGHIWSTTIVTGCQVYSNTADGYGGGAGFRGRVTIANSGIYSNTTEGNGGGVILGLYSQATMTGNQIYANTATWGGGIQTDRCNATIADNDIYSNTADNGGGININEADGNWVTLAGNRIYSNTAVLGGGILAGHCGITMTGNLIYANTAEGSGGGISLFSNVATLENDIVANNQTTAGTAGIHANGSQVHMANTTIARNTGGPGVRLSGYSGETSRFIMTNTILVSHTTGIYINTGQTATLEATLWGDDNWANETDWYAGGTIYTGTVNIWGDPAFVLSTTIDYHIALASAALNAGVDTGVTTDIDGQTRPLNIFYDIGADELDVNDYACAYLPLVTRDY